MSFQFGTNWPGFMEKAGNIAGPLLGYEVLTAFFLEATFLGVMLFGRDRVPRWMHTLSAVLVAVGTTASAFWILALNSWMQTPQGYNDDRRQAARRRLVGDHLQSELPVPVHAHADRVGLDGGVPGRRALGVPAAAQSRFDAGARHAAHRRAAWPRCSRRCRSSVGDHARAEHARASAREDRRHRGASGTPSATCPCCCSPCPTRSSSATTTRSRFPTARAWILTPRAPTASCTGLNEFDGKHPPVSPVFFAFRVMVGVGHADARAVRGSARGARCRDGASCRAGCCACSRAMTFSGWVGGAGRLAGHRDRPPAVPGLRRPHHRGGRVGRPRARMIARDARRAMRWSTRCC